MKKLLWTLFLHIHRAKILCIDNIKFTIERTPFGDIKKIEYGGGKMDRNSYLTGYSDALSDINSLLLKVCSENHITVSDKSQDDVVSCGKQIKTEECNNGKTGI